MGAWGLGNFENDDALDWVNEFVHTRDPMQIKTAFSEILDLKTSSLNAFVCARGLAAAEYIALMIGHPSNDIPDELKPAFKEINSPDDDLIQQGITMVNIILESSELKDLYVEVGEFNKWKAIEDDLISRLSKPPSGRLLYSEEVNQPLIAGPDIARADRKRKLLRFALLVSISFAILSLILTIVLLLIS